MVGMDIADRAAAMKGQTALGLDFVRHTSPASTPYYPARPRSTAPDILANTVILPSNG